MAAGVLPVRQPPHATPPPGPDFHRVFAVYSGAMAPAAAARTPLKTKGSP